jgi:ABC-type transport system involved in multi-copper enzyme maturation permease subunit
VSEHLRVFAALVRETWLEFVDAKSLWLVLATIAILFGVALTIRVEPMPAGRTYLDLAARGLSADIDDIDLAEATLGDVASRLDGSLSWVQSAEPRAADGSGEVAAVDGPATSWRVTLVRNTLPLLGERADAASIEDRFGRVADGRLWQVREICETTGSLTSALGGQSWEMLVDPGPDLAILWPHRLTLFGDALELTPPRGAPLGLEVFILQKLLATGIGGTILLLVSVVITAAFVPNMIRKGTLELLLVRPVRRWQLVIGKYTAALLFVAGLLGVLVGATWLVTGLVAGLWAPGILLAVASLLLFFGLLLSVSTFAGVVTRSAPAAMLVTVAFWAVLFVVGIMHAQVAASRVREELVGKPRPLTVADALRGRTEARPPLEPQQRPFHRTTAGRTIEAVHAVLPHTSDLDAMVDRQLMRGFAVSGRLRQLLESGEFSWAGGVGLTLAHTVAFLTAACLIFARRDP